MKARCAESELQYYRARYYHSELGRFVSRDPIGCEAGDMNIYRYVGNIPTNSVDPTGLKDCKITVYGGHNYNVINGIKIDYPQGIPPGECITGVGCGVITSSGKRTSLQGWIIKEYPDNSIKPINQGKTNTSSNPYRGVMATSACLRVKRAMTAAYEAADKMLSGLPVRSGKRRHPKCDTVTVTLKCDKDMAGLFKDGSWQGRKLGKQYWESCKGLCDRYEIIGPSVRKNR